MDSTEYSLQYNPKGAIERQEKIVQKGNGNLISDSKSFQGATEYGDDYKNFDRSTYMNKTKPIVYGDNKIFNAGQKAKTSASSYTKDFEYKKAEKNHQYKPSHITQVYHKESGGNGEMNTFSTTSASNYKAPGKSEYPQKVHVHSNKSTAMKESNDVTNYETNYTNQFKPSSNLLGKIEL